MAAKIFIVEDNRDSREMLACLLDLSGYQVVCATDGEEALALLQTEHPDLIITDIQMPNMDGIELIKKLRKQPDMTEVPILVMSAYRSGMVNQALEAGANAATRKPVQFDALLQTVKHLLPLPLFMAFTALFC